jgi:hypothetical protein
MKIKANYIEFTTALKILAYSKTGLNALFLILSV